MAGISVGRRYLKMYAYSFLKTFKSILILIDICLNDNKSALVDVMAWRLRNDAITSTNVDLAVRSHVAH